MEAPLQGSEEVVGEKETPEGSVAPQYWIDCGDPLSLPVESTETKEIIDDDGSSSVNFFQI